MAILSSIEKTKNKKTCFVRERLCYIKNRSYFNKKIQTKNRSFLLK